MPNWKIEFLALKILKFALKSFDPKTLGPRTKTTFYKFDAGEGGTICVLTPKMSLENYRFLKRFATLEYGDRA